MSPGPVPSPFRTSLDPLDANHLVSNRRTPAWLTLVTALTLPHLLIAGTPASTAGAAPGGFVESATSTEVRPRVTPALPSRGRFTFPSPYHTTGVRLTNESDCGNGDCVLDVGYSYWRNMNNHVGDDTILIFLTLDRAKGGGGPTLFSYNKITDEVTVVGSLFDPSHPLSWATAEGWYWSATLPAILYITTGASVYRYDVYTRQMDLVVNAADRFGSNRYIWQTHVNNGDTIFSGTLRDTTTFDSLGCLVYNDSTDVFSFFAKTGEFDECQVDKGGSWLVIKQQLDNANDVDNVIVNVLTGQQTTFLDQAGAPGHSDTGFGYMVGNDNWYGVPGAVRVWTFGQPFPSSQPGTPPQGRLVYRTTDWAADLGVLSHTNATPGIASTEQFACGSNARREELPRNNEIVCFRLDGSLQVVVVAPVMTDLNAPGGGDDYHKQPKGNLDVTGQYFIWTSNVGGSRLDAFIVKVPTQLLAPGAPERPDLVSTALSNPPTAVAPGSTWSASDTVKNEGSVSAAASTTRYYLSLDTTKAAVDVLLSKVRGVPSLAAGASYAGGAITITIPSTTALNTYYLLACADDTGVVTELDEGNNCRASATPVQVTRPDLVVTAVSNPPLAIAPGAHFPVTDTAKNQGAVLAGNAPTRYYLSADAQKGSGDILLVGSRGVPSLATGASHAGGAIAITIPSTTALNTYYLLACADDTGVVTELDEGNNCRVSATPVQVTRPDLVVTAVSNPPLAIAPGAHFPVTDTAKNQGAVLAGSAPTRYYLSADGEKGTGDSLLVGSRGVPSLAPGASHAGGAITITIPSTTALNTYYLLACADDTGVVTELDDGNNCRASAIPVQVTRPDLVVTAVSNPPATALRGSRVTVTDTVKNQGVVLAASATTRYYLSVDGEKGSGDILLVGSRAVPTLAAGVSNAGPVISLTIPSTAPSGTYFVLACADDTVVVVETSESNNCKASASQIVVG
jgi:hypothetical protein